MPREVEESPGRVMLRLAGVNLDPKQITRTLGIEPDFWLAKDGKSGGPMMASFKKQSLKPRRNGVWVHLNRERSPESVQRQLEHWCDIVVPNREQLQPAIEGVSEACLMCHIPESIALLTLSPTVLARLALTGLDVVVILDSSESSELDSQLDTSPTKSE